MSAPWKREQILALAPDAAAVQAAQGLATPRKWVTLGTNAGAVWGECQGSGAKPYQIVIELAEPAFKCTCPSRKLPCKHTLALFLLFASDPAPFAAIAAPPWVDAWLSARAKRQEAKTNKSTDKVVDEKAQAKRIAEREQKVAQGVAELTLWLKDAVRAGLAELRTRPYAFWQQMAARLIDAQAPGLAAQVQTLGKLIVTGEHWAEQTTQAVARLFLLLEAYQRLDQLPTLLQSDVRTLIGWAQSKEDVVSGPAVRGRWRVLSQQFETTEGIINQRVWLQNAASQQFALLLNFAHESNRQSLDAHWQPGEQVDGDLCFYASAVPLRASVTQLHKAGHFIELTDALPLQAALQRYQQGLAQQPWLTRFPLLLAQVVVLRTVAADETQRWFLADSQQQQLPLNRRCKQQPWQMLSITGGAPAHIFGEWQDDGFWPLGLWHEARYWTL
ncbi:MAG: SWIM zinc finger family protein [Caldilineaceae bacterium]